MIYLILGSILLVGIYCQYKRIKHEMEIEKESLMRIKPKVITSLSELKTYMEAVPCVRWSHFAKNLYEMILLENKTLISAINKKEVSVLFGHIYFTHKGEVGSISMLLNLQDVQKPLEGGNIPLPLKTDGAYIYAQDDEGIYTISTVFERLNSEVAKFHLNLGLKLRNPMWEKGRYVFLNPVTHRAEYQNGKKFNGFIEGYSYEIF